MAIPVAQIDPNGIRPHGNRMVKEDKTLRDLNDMWDADGLVRVVTEGEICTDNSTTTPLSAGATFTGAAQDILDYAMILVLVKSDVASATDGLSVQFSPDGTNWDSTDEFTVPANRGKTWSFQTAARYFRIVYTNGASDQTYFRLQAIKKRTYTKPSSHRIQDSIISDDDAELVKAVLTGKNPAGTFVNFQATTAGNFKMSLEELESGVSSNNNTQLNVTQYTSSGAEIGVDASTNALEFVDYEHHEIHSGSHYFIHDVADLANNGVFDVQWTTPNTAQWAHFVFMLQCSSETEWYIYEGATIATPGTALSPVNNNRNSDKTSNATIASIANTSLALANADTPVAAATELAHGKVGAGKSGGIDDRTREIVLKQNTIYCMRAIANAAGYVNFLMEWYEHTDKSVLPHTESSSSSSS